MKGAKVVSEATRRASGYSTRQKHHYTYGVKHFEVINGFEVLQYLFQLWLDVEFVGVLVVMEEGPEFLETVHLSSFVVFQSLRLEVLVYFRPELLLKTVAEKSEEAFQTVSENK